MMDWKRMFRPHILDRGLDYYQRGLVEDFDEDYDYVQATVQGSEEYDVCIDTLNGEIVDMNCDCPYADGGEYCKHMAAVLFFMDAEHAKSRDTKSTETAREMISKESTNVEKSIRMLVAEADEKAVRDFLSDILENDEQLYLRFKSSLHCEISADDIKRYKNQIRSIFKQYGERYGYIDYRNARLFIADLVRFLEDDIQGMMDNKQYKETFELTTYIFTEIGSQDMDDSDGGTGEVAGVCAEIWQEILDQCDMELQWKIFRWCTECLNDSLMDHMEERVEEILFDNGNFAQKEFIAEKLIFTENQVSKYKNEKPSWSRGYHAGQWAISHINVMIENNASEREIEEYCKENLEFDEVRKFCIRECTRKNDYKMAIRLLKEGKIAAQDSPGLVHIYSEQLKQLYKQMGDQKSYEEELWSLILKYDVGNVEIYREIRSLYTQAEWSEKREIIFKQLPMYADIDSLYMEDKLYDRLLTSVINASGLHKLIKYEACLKKMYPDELLAKYERTVSIMASQASGRKEYHELVDILRKMKAYPNGAQRVDEIVREWKVTYKNRRAMMDELSAL